MSQDRVESFRNAYKDLRGDFTLIQAIIGISTTLFFALLSQFNVTIPLLILFSFEAIYTLLIVFIVPFVFLLRGNTHIES